MSYNRTARASGFSIFLWGLLISAILGCALGFVSGWALMIAIGVVHAEVLPAVIPCGYGPSYALALLLILAFGLRDSVVND